MIDLFTPSDEKTLSYLRGRLDGAGFAQSQVALAVALAAYEGKTRKNGRPYAMHPVEMACDAIAHKGITDEMIATILLHDVYEENGQATRKSLLLALPVNDIVKRAVELMTIRPLGGETKPETKRRYFNELLASKEAVVCKGFDRIYNLNDAEGALSEEAIVKNINETHELLMPILKEAKYAYPELSDMLHILRTSLKRTARMMARYHNVELK